MATDRDPQLDLLAGGANCPRCGAPVDVPCRTPSGASAAPHAARVDRAVARYLAAKAAATRSG